jgi:hypothetical protein
MIHGCNIIYSSNIAVMIKLQQQQQQSCSTASSPGAAASCSSSNSNSNNSARKSTDHSYYVHQSQTGEYYYKAPAAAADHKVKRGNSKSLQAAGKIMITRAGGIFRTCRHADDLTTAATAGDNTNNNNMCLVRRCCECSSSNSRPAVSRGTATAAAAASRPILHLWQNIITLMLQLAQDLQELLLLLPTIEALVLHLQLLNVYAPNVVKLSPLLKFLSFTKSRVMPVSEQHLGLQVLELFVPSLLKISSDDLSTYFSLQIRLQSFKPFCCLFCS